MAKLTESDVLEMRRRYAAGGISHSALGTAFGVSKGAVSAALSGKNWAHLKGGLTKDP